MAKRYLDYKDSCITIFNDDSKSLIVFVTDNGKSKVVSYDDNFYSVESLLDTYLEMIEESFKGWKSRELNDNDYEEIKEYLKRYYKHVKRQCDIDLDYVSDHTRKMLVKRG